MASIEKSNSSTEKGSESKELPQFTILDTNDSKQSLIVHTSYLLKSSKWFQEHCTKTEITDSSDSKICVLLPFSREAVETFTRFLYAGGHVEPASEIAFKYVLEACLLSRFLESPDFQISSERALEHQITSGSYKPTITDLEGFSGNGLSKNIEKQIRRNITKRVSEGQYNIDEHKSSVKPETWEYINLAIAKRKATLEKAKVRSEPAGDSNREAPATGGTGTTGFGSDTTQTQFSGTAAAKTTGPIQMPAQNSGGGLFGSNNHSTPSGGLFGTPARKILGYGLFGNAIYEGDFDKNNTQPSSGLFGNSQNQPQSSIFGRPQQNNSGGLFGNNNNNNSQPSNGLFGDSQSQSQSATWLFDRPQQNNSGGLFGNNNNNNPQPGGRIFGNDQSHSQPSNSIFGRPAQSSYGGLFGNNINNNSQPVGGLFGSSHKNDLQVSSGNGFGNIQQNGGCYPNAGSSSDFGNGNGFGSNTPHTGGMFGHTQNQAQASCCSLGHVPVWGESPCRTDRTTPYDSGFVSGRLAVVPPNHASNASNCTCEHHHVFERPQNNLYRFAELHQGNGEVVYVYHHISFEREKRMFSPEELRLADYDHGRKHVDPTELDILRGRIKELEQNVKAFSKAPAPARSRSRPPVIYTPTSSSASSILNSPTEDFVTIPNSNTTNTNPKRKAPQEELNYFHPSIWQRVSKVSNEARHLFSALHTYSSDSQPFGINLKVIERTCNFSGAQLDKRLEELRCAGVIRTGDRMGWSGADCFWGATTDVEEDDSDDEEDEVL